MPSLKHMKPQSQCPIKKGDVVVIQDMFKFEFTVTVKSASLFEVVATEPLKIRKFLGLQNIPIVDNGFSVVKVNGEDFSYSQFFNGTEK